MQKKLISFLIFFLSLVLSLWLVVSQKIQKPQAAWLAVCTLVEQKIFISNNTINKWLKNCFSQASERGSETSEEAFRSIQSFLDKLNYSHLKLYTSLDNSRMWEGQFRTTGLRSRFVEGELVIYEVLEGSPAQMTQIRKGDVLITQNSESPNPWQSFSEGGEFIIESQGRLRTIQLEAIDLKVREEPRIKDLNLSTAVFEPKTFRPEFYDSESWILMAHKLKKYQNIIIDLRSHRGGNFVAMLRVLSSFICQPTSVGALLQPRKTELPQNIDLIDTLDAGEQVSLLSKGQKIELKTYKDYPCIKAKLKVLVDSETASTAEVFAQALRENLGTSILGSTTSGQVLMAVWYDLPELGADYSLSIPEADYLTAKQVRLEEAGVQPDETLYYKLSEEKLGIDSWLKVVLTYFNFNEKITK